MLHPLTCSPKLDIQLETMDSLTSWAVEVNRIIDITTVLSGAESPKKTGLHRVNGPLTHISRLEMSFTRTLHPLALQKSQGSLRFPLD